MQVVQAISNVTLLTSPIISRSICLSGFGMNKYAAREGRFLAKVMKASPRKKKNWSSFENNHLPQLSEMSQPHGSKGSRRAAVLNKLFMKNITGLMATGEVAPEIIGKGIEISQVKVTSDFSLVNVYWCAKGTENDNEIENTLNTVAGKLRHELTQLRVMGAVPRIQFVKDKVYLKAAEVERLLQIADMGEDCTPTDDSSLLHSEFMGENQNPLVQNQKDQDSLCELLDDVEYYRNLNLPVMRMDVLGLDHTAIMKKITRSLKKAKASHRLEDNENSVCMVESAVNTEQRFEHLSPKQKKLELNKFLSHRKTQKEKARSQHQLDREIFETDVPVISPFSNYLYDDLEEQDFIEEDDNLDLK